MPEAELIRFVANPDGVVVPDLAAKLPGRGMWVRASSEAVTQAAQKGHFSRAAKESLNAPTDLAVQVCEGLLARLGSGLGLASRAAALVTGFDSVRDTLKAGRAAILIEASDGAEDGRNKIFALAHGLGAKVRVLGAFASEELSLALGRSNVIHAAVQKGPLAEKLGLDMGRLAGFMALAPSDWRLPGGAQPGPGAAMLQSGVA